VLLEFVFFGIGQVLGMGHPLMRFARGERAPASKLGITALISILRLCPIYT